MTKQNLFNISLAFFSVCFIFLWDFNNNLFEIRYLFLLLIIPVLFSIYSKLLKKNYSFFLIISILILINLFHLTINYTIDGKIISLHNYLSLIFFILIFSIVYFFHIKIIDNLDLIIIIFYIVFFIATLYSIINLTEDVPYFCGGLNNALGRSVSFTHILFSENSHLGMIAPAVILYSINRIFKKRMSLLFVISTVLFFLICYIKSSTTYISGIILSTFIITIFNYNFIKKKTLIFFSVIVLILTFSFINDDQCKRRLIPKYSGENLVSQNFTSFTENTFFPNKKQNEEVGGLSSGLFFRSLMITKHYIISKPFGWGFNRYDLAFDEYNTIYPPKNSLLKDYNKKDGINNFNKITVEFGVFSIILYVLIFRYLINREINIDEKMFLIPIVITQLIRGAGYFNGGFILIILLIVFSYLKKIK
tara:strand:- start:37 stop:1299 length:1263 start_codon:yes stop_codon:yes gene_type:complete